jgi:general secretion pathway protein D
MNTSFRLGSATLILLTLMVALATSRPAQAQFNQGGGGRPQGVNRGTGGGAGGGRALGGGGGGGGGASTRQFYPPGTVGEAIVTSDPETRRLIVITDEETSMYVSQVVTNLDRPKPQVLIKVVFLECTYRNSLDLGVEMGGLHSKNAAVQGAGTSAFGSSGLGSAASALVTNVFGIPLQSLAPVPPGAGVYQIMGSDFQATLRALAQAGKTEVLSRPSILTRNNQMATITLGQEVPLITNTRFDTLGNQINTVTYQNVGIILRVTPFITDDGKVEMIVTPESSSLADRSQWVPISSGSGGSISAPVINSRSADTVVVVPDGQTVVIGGLMEKAKTQSDAKVPFLGDIPLFGALFKHKLKDDTKTELIIFLTPYIVAEAGQLAKMSTPELNRSQLAPKAFTEEDLDLFLRNITPKDEKDTKKLYKDSKESKESNKDSNPDPNKDPNTDSK